MTDGLKDAHREAIIAVIAANDRVERAVLFGSRATGTNTVTSDVDIALFGDRLTLTHRARLTAALEEIPMAQTVDLLLYDSIQDRALREHIRNEGVEWYRRLTTSEAKPHLEDEDNGTTITLEGVHTRQWSTVQLGEVANLLTGFPFRSDKYVSDPEAPRLLRGANIAQGILRWDAAKRWPQEANEHLAPYWLRKGDVVIAMDRPWIEAGLKSSSVRETDLPSLLVQRVARLRGSDRLDTRFLSYVIGCHDFAQHILSVQTGTAVPHISAQQIKEFEFLLPHVHEQRAIAHILGTLDDKIELNRRMNETLEAMARALFKSWFVDFDPVRAKMEGRDTGLPQDIADLFPDRLVDSEMGEIPEGWQVRSRRRRGQCEEGSIRQARQAIRLTSADMPRGSIAPEWGRERLSRKCTSRPEISYSGSSGPLPQGGHRAGGWPFSTDIVVLGARQPKWSALVLACVSSSASSLRHQPDFATGDEDASNELGTAMAVRAVSAHTDAIASDIPADHSPLFLRIVANESTSPAPWPLSATLYSPSSSLANCGCTLPRSCSEEPNDPDQSHFASTRLWHLPQLQVAVRPSRIRPIQPDLRLEWNGQDNPESTASRP